MESPPLPHNPSVLMVQVGALLVLLAFTSIGPGLLIVRRLDWRPIETLCAAIALSHLLLYAAAMAVYVLGIPLQTIYLVSFSAVLATAACWSDLRRLWRRRQVRHVVYAIVGLFAWAMTMQLVVRNYSGGTWWGDWYEHYERAKFFIDRPDVNKTFLNGVYVLSARPPLMNVLAAFYMAQIDTGFGIFQIVFTFLNILPVAGAALLLPMLIRGARRPILLLAAVCALNPLYIQNSLWTWTKLYVAFLVLLATALYLRGLREPGHARLVGSFAALAVAALAHYSAGVFVIFMAAHYLIATFPRRVERWRELAAITVVGAVILSTWFGWSLSTYGAQVTFGQNSTVHGYAAAPPMQKLNDAMYNVYATAIPYPLRGEPLPPIAGRTNSTATLRDSAYHLYQTNLLLAFGAVGWLLVAYLLARALKYDDAANRRERHFWLALLFVCIPFGVATVGQRETYGLAHIAAQPIIVLGLALVAAGFDRVPRVLRLAYVSGLAIDFLAGILLHIHLQSVSFRLFEAPTGQTLIDPTPGLGTVAVANFRLKQGHGLAFLGDHLAAWRSALEGILVLGALVMLLYIAARGRLRANAVHPHASRHPAGPARRVLCG